MSARVSVVMAVRDGEAFVEAAAESILQQRWSALELVIVDDGSRDGTAQLLEAIRRRDGRVRVVHQAPSGLAAALNRACACSSGEYLARQDADDLSKPGRLELQIDYLDACPAVAAVGTAAEMIDERGAVIGMHASAHGPRRVRQELASLRSTPVHGSVMMRRAAFERVGGYREAFRMAQDLDLWLRMLERDELDNLPETLYRWRMNPRGVYMTQRPLQLRYAGIAATFARERRRWGVDSYEALAAAGGDLDRFAAGYRLRGELHGLWGELLFRGLRSPSAARPHLRRALLSGHLRPRTVGLLGWSLAAGLAFPGGARDAALQGGMAPEG